MTVTPLVPTNAALDMVRKLGTQSDENMQTLIRLDQYLDGKQPLSWIAPEIVKSTEGRLRSLVIGWPRLVITALEERLDVEGFRTASSDKPDHDLWGIWQSNNLDEASQQAHIDALVYGRSYVLVWADNHGQPVVSVESPKQVTIKRYPGSRVLQYALKRWIADGKGHAVLFTETNVYRFQSIGSIPVEDFPSYGSGWEQTNTLTNPLGVVPVVPLVNSPRVLTPDGQSELADLLPIFDALNKLHTDLMVASEFGALPRRWATGIDIPEVRDDLGNPTGDVSTEDIFSQLPGRVWLAENPEARLGEFSGAELSGFSNAIATLTQSLGALTGLPPHYLGLHGDQPASADAIRSAEASLVARAKRKQRVFGGAWEQVMRLAAAIQLGRFNPDLERLETVWASPETRSVAQSVDAAAKAVDAGLITPDFAAELYLGLTPTQVARIGNCGEELHSTLRLQR